MTSKEKQYNEALTASDLTRQEEFNPSLQSLLTYSKPSSTCDGFPSGKLGNMAGGYPFNLLGTRWLGSEFLYLCGEWSQEGDRSVEIQNYVRQMKSGAWAWRCSKAKYKNEIRSDFPMFRHQWMLWCVWQKCKQNKDFARLLMSVPDDRIVVEVEEHDPVWAVIPSEQGVLRGCNAMGKILTICKRCLVAGTEPEIDTQLLNAAGIFILGNRITF